MLGVCIQFPTTTIFGADVENQQNPLAYHTRTRLTLYLNFTETLS